MNPIEEQIWKQSEVLRWQHALIFLFCGIVILGSHGAILQTPLYIPISGGISSIGFFMFQVGAFYCWAIYTRRIALCRFFTWVTGLMWFVLAGFYLASMFHTIGAVTCLVLAGTQIHDDIFHLAPLRGSKKGPPRFIGITLSSIKNRKNHFATYPENTEISLIPQETFVTKDGTHDL